MSSSSSAANRGSSTPSASTSSSTIHANIEKRNAKMELRKRELLLEARKARVDWILDKNHNVTTKGADVEWDGATNPLKDLQACNSNIMPNAPDIIQGLLSSRCDWADCSESTITSKIVSNVKNIMERDKLQWSSISKLPNDDDAKLASGVESLKISETMHHDLNLTPIPPPTIYNQFLEILCDPSAADVVISIQSFCKTVKEAARVMISLQDGSSDDGKDSTNTSKSTTNDKKSELKQKLSVQNHTLSLVKAMRGFVNSTTRDMEKHTAFKSFLLARGDNESNAGSSDDDNMKDELVECLEKFLYTKCRNDINSVLSWEVEHKDDEHYHTLRGSIKKEQNPLVEMDNKYVGKLVKDSEVEMHEKLKCLQFVTPKHLEIRCLASSATSDIDLSYPMQQLKVLSDEPSVRQMLQTVLLTFRGINAALSSATHQQSTPPGADDVLPTLILTVIRANPPGLLTSLLFIERFAPVSLLRGEAGYAYTNLCGAVQFLKDLDMKEHMADVSMGEGAVLSIDPAEFRAGLEKCRIVMKAEQGEKRPVANSDGVQPTRTMVGDMQESEDGESQFDLKITAKDIRHARNTGCTADLDWALQRQKDFMWKEGNVRTDFNSQEKATNGASNNVSFLPPEEPPLPSNFSRSYSFLSTSPNDVRMSDLPKLLKEYRMLVHVTESLLNERQSWRESERKRLVRMEREKLELAFEEVIGKSV